MSGLNELMEFIISPAFVSTGLIFATSVAIGLGSGWVIGHKYSRRALNDTKDILDECRTILEEDIKPPPIEAIFLIKEAQIGLEKMDEWNPAPRQKKTETTQTPVDETPQAN